MYFLHYHDTVHMLELLKVPDLRSENVTIESQLPMIGSCIYQSEIRSLEAYLAEFCCFLNASLSLTYIARICTWRYRSVLFWLIKETWKQGRKSRRPRSRS